jgi:hypothetical protein
MHLPLNLARDSAISVVAMTGAVIVIDNAAATETILSVKQRVFAANRELPVRRQRLVYRPGPRGLEALADDETLGGAGVARDGTAELDVLMEPFTESEISALGEEVFWLAALLVFVPWLSSFSHHRHCETRTVDCRGPRRQGGRHRPIHQGWRQHGGQRQGACQSMCAVRRDCMGVNVKLYLRLFCTTTMK